MNRIVEKHSEVHRTYGNINSSTSHTNSGTVVYFFLSCHMFKTLLIPADMPVGSMGVISVHILHRQGEPTLTVYSEFLHPPTGFVKGSKSCSVLKLECLVGWAAAGGFATLRLSVTTEKNCTPATTQPNLMPQVRQPPRRGSTPDNQHLVSILVFLSRHWCAN